MSVQNPTTEELVEYVDSVLYVNSNPAPFTIDLVRGVPQVLRPYLEELMRHALHLFPEIKNHLTVTVRIGHPHGYNGLAYNDTRIDLCLEELGCRLLFHELTHTADYTAGRYFGGYDRKWARRPHEQRAIVRAEHMENHSDMDGPWDEHKWAVIDLCSVIKDKLNEIGAERAAAFKAEGKKARMSNEERALETGVYKFSMRGWLLAEFEYEFIDNRLGYDILNIDELEAIRLQTFLVTNSKRKSDAREFALPVDADDFLRLADAIFHWARYLSNYRGAAVKAVKRADTLADIAREWREKHPEGQ